MDQAELGEPDIEIAALRIWVHGREFEDAEDYWDGNWLRATAHCAASGASSRAHGSILHLGELVGFLDECAVLHKTLEGKAELSCIEPNLGVELSTSESRGNIDVNVRLTPDHLTQEHLFRFAIDQSYLPGIIKGIRKVLESFPVRGRPE